MTRGFAFLLALASPCQGCESQPPDTVTAAPRGVRRQQARVTISFRRTGTAPRVQTITMNVTKVERSDQLCEWPDLNPCRRSTSYSDYDLADLLILLHVAMGVDDTRQWKHLVNFRRKGTRFNMLVHVSCRLPQQVFIRG